jgi:hypothetical protein
MNVAEFALIILGVLLCVGVILSIKEYIAFRKALSQSYRHRQQPEMNWMLLVPQPLQAKVLPIWGNLKEKLLVQEQGVATKTNIAQLRQSLTKQSARKREEG